ncbi:MAG TPA: glycosyltransferase [Polyangia bacterium]|nr:glycosyltransferase [Polyangia bacterium]
MRVLFTHRAAGAYGVISESWINACRGMGIEARRWDGDAESWRAFDPDVYVGCSAHRQPIPPPGRGRRARVALHVNPLPAGSATTGVDEPAAGVAWVKGQAPDAVFGYAHEHDRGLWDGWHARVGCPFVPLATAGDLTLYRPRPELAGTLGAVYVGGYWPYKARSIDRFLLPAVDRFGLRLYGWGPWPRPAGAVSDEELPALLARARLGPCVSEPHTHALGIDLPERVFKVILAGAVPLHDPAANVRRVLPSLPVAASPEEYLAAGERLLALAEPARRELSRALIAEVLRGHTYPHRMSALLAALGFPGYARAAARAAADYARDAWRA